MITFLITAFVLNIGFQYIFYKIIGRRVTILEAIGGGVLMAVVMNLMGLSL